MPEWSLPVAVTALLSVTGSFFAFSRRALTKKDHETICSAKSDVVSVQLAALATSLEEVKTEVRGINNYLREGGK